MTISEVFSAAFLSIRYLRARRGGKAHPTRNAPAWHSLLRGIAAVALPVSAAALASNLLFTANTVLLPRRLIASGMAPGDALGALGVLFGMAQPLFFLPAVFVGPLAMLLLPKLSEGHALRNTADVRRKIQKAIHAVGLLALPIIAAIVPLGPTLCRLLYQQELPEQYFLLLAVATVFAYYHTITASVLNALEKQNRAMIHTLIGGVVQLSFTWFAVAQPSLRVTGFLLGLAAGSFITTGLNLQCISARTGLRLRWSRHVAMPALSAIITGMFTRLVFGMLEPAAMPDAAAVALSFAAGGLIFAFTLWVQGINLIRYWRALLPELRLFRRDAVSAGSSMLFF